MALLCGAYSVFLRKFSCRVSHVRNLRIYGKIMFQMSVLPCLTVRRITVPSSRSSQFLCICQLLSKLSGQIYGSHIGSKIVSCFCQIVSLCCWDTYKMCAKIWAPESWKIRCFVTHKRIDHDLKSWSKSVFFDWLTESIEFVIIWHKMLNHLAKCKSDL